MGNRLSSVRFLEVVISVPGLPNSCHLSKLQRQSARQPQLTDAASTSIATMLAAACPVIRHLGMGGSVGSAAYRVLGNLCPLLTSWELLYSPHKDMELLQTVIREQLLPHVHHIKMLKLISPYSGDGDLCVQLLCQSTTLN